MAKPRKPTKQEEGFLEKAMRWARSQRDAAVNNARTRADGSRGVTHLPTPTRTKKDILEELGGAKKKKK